VERPSNPRRGPGAAERSLLGVLIVKYTVALLLGVSALLVVPVQAKGIEDVVRANCTKEIIGTTNTSRNQVKKFTIRKVGGGYEMSGFDENNHTVVCKTTAEGRVTWVG
jgi:hypothetical protein